MRYVTLLFLWFCLGFTGQGQNKLDNPFFVFNNGVKDAKYPTIEQQMRLLTENAFDGMEKNGLDNFEEVYQALQKNELELFTIYTNINLDNPGQAFDPRLEDVFKKIRGSTTMPWLYVTSQKYPSSSSEYDTLAVPIIQQVADLAQRYGLRIMLYPHMFFWLESVEDAIRVVEKVDRPNVGFTFNLCHYLAHRNRSGQDPWVGLKALSQQAMPHLFAISINGADSQDTDQEDIWSSFIQPLGEGDFDTYRFLTYFLQQGFSGPVGLQCYNIDQDKAVHLRKSMDTWRDFQQHYASE